MTSTKSDEKGSTLEHRLALVAKLRGHSVDSIREEVVALGLLAVERLIALERLRADILIVTTTSTEFDEFRSAATHPDRALKFERLKGEAATYHHLGTIAGERVAVIRLRSMGSFTSQGSAFTCHRVRIETGATTFIVVGTAFGIDERMQKIGDVLVSESLILYDECDVRDEPEGAYKYHYPDRATVLATEFWVETFRRAAEADQNTAVIARGVHFGRLLTGGARIESADFRNTLATRVPPADSPIIGGEMEAAGVAAVCADETSGWIAVKGVSDFATTESRGGIKTHRVIAARHAANFTLDTLMKRVF